MNPTVSVIIPTYNRAEMIVDAVESVLQQTFADFELIVVDDGSTDNTKEVIERFTDPRIRYVYQENRERSAARNTGIRLAKGQYLAFLDADDWWLPDKLSAQMDIFDIKPEAGLVYTGAYRIRNGRIFAEKKCRHQGNVIRPLLVEGNIVVGSSSAALIRRECFEQVGGFDESLSVLEDWDMWLRIAKRYEFAYVPRPLVKIRLHAESTEVYAGKTEPGTLDFLNKVLTNPYLEDDVRPVRHRFESLIYWTLGHYCYRGHQTGAARRYFLKSLRLYPFQLRGWLYLFLALLGDRPAEMMRTGWHWLLNSIRYRNAG